MLIHEHASGRDADRINAATMGAKGDGVTDDTDAIQRAIAEAGKQQISLLLPAGNYLVRQPLVGVSNLHLEASGATLQTAIQAVGDSSTAVPTLRLNDVENVSITGLRIDGRADDFGPTEYKHCISIEGSENVLIDQCTLFNAKGDGLILNDLRRGAHNRNITVRDTSCIGNYRLGLAVTDAEVASFTNCLFSGNRGTSPMGGVDIEPDRDDCIVKDITFDRCEMSGNGIVDNDGAGVYVFLRENPSAPQENITFTNCTISSNGIHGVIIYHGYNVVIEDCEITQNSGSGLAVFRTSSNVTIRRGEITLNRVNGVEAIRDKNQQLRILKFDNVLIEDNSLANLGRYDGIHLKGDCRDITVQSCTISGSHRYGIWASDDVQNVVVNDTSLTGNLTGSTFPKQLDH